MNQWFSGRAGFVDPRTGADLQCPMDTRTSEPAAAGAASAEALLQSALQAAHAGDDERMLALLRDSVRASHHNPAAHYLLGAECAQRKHFGDAVLHLTTAVDQAPGMAVARLQLGLLWITQGNPAAALAQLGPLADLPEGDALRHFGEALSGLCRDDVPEAQRQLRLGLDAPCDNALLRTDMQRLLDALQARLAQTAADARLPAAEAVSVSHGMAISAYAQAETRDDPPRR